MPRHSPSPPLGRQVDEPTAPPGALLLRSCLFAPSIEVFVGRLNLLPGLALAVLGLSWSAGGCSISDENDATAGPTTIGEGGGASTTTTSLTTTTGNTTSTSTTGTGGGAGGGIPSGDGVLCGDITCPPEQPICCAGSGPVCTADQGDATCAGTIAATEFILYCDHSSACSAGELCCHVDGNIDKFVCTPGATCDLGEACLPDGTCAQAGFDCVADPDEPTGAKCVALGAVVTCDQSTCQGATPECCDDGAGTMTCQAASAGCAFGLDCDDAADCAAGYSCCFAGGASFCGGSCPSYILCADAADCPDVANMTKACEVDPAAGAPGGWLVCTYK